MITAEINNLTTNHISVFFNTNENKYLLLLFSLNRQK